MQSSIFLHGWVTNIHKFYFDFIDDDLCGDSDTELESNLTPGTEAKYNKIDEEFQLIMQHRNNNANGNRVSGNS